MKIINGKKYYTQTEAAEIKKVTPQAIHNAIKRKTMETFPVTETIHLIPESALQK